MASNVATLNDGYGGASDWIELHNNGDQAVDVAGYHLTDKASNLTKWTFPISKIVAPNEYLVVFASGRDTIDPAGNFHANFSLSAGGEYVGLSDVEGTTVLSEFGSASTGSDYPPQMSDISYGVSAIVFVDADSPSTWHVPTQDIGLSWRNNDYSNSGLFTDGKAAIGYETAPLRPTSYSNEIRTTVPVGSDFVYQRTQFQFADTTAINQLILSVKYDDGFAAFLNGTLVASRNSPTSLEWNSVASSEHPDPAALVYEDFNLSSSIGVLVNGTNTLAIQAMDRASGGGSLDFLLSPRLTANNLAGPVSYLTNATPGGPNSGVIKLGPTIGDVTSSGASVSAGQRLLVTASVTPFQAQSVNTTSVRLHYRTMYNREFSTFMNDSGVGGDEAAGDQIYSAFIPASATTTAGQMLRWYVTAEDNDNNPTRAPRFLYSDNSAEYLGTVILDPAIDTDLPLIQWFVENASAADTSQGTRASLFYLGKFYDNMQVDVHGQSTRGFPKKSHDFDANSGDKFFLGEEIGSASDFNLLTNYADQTKVRHPLAYEVYAEAGHPALTGFTTTVYLNGSFYGLFDIIEEGDEEFLERVGLDPNGALYKINNALTSSTTDVEKKSRNYENNSDLQKLVDNNGSLRDSATIWDFDNLEIATIINNLAIHALIGNTDGGHKNMYWYHDNDITGQWYMLPWDQDLSFGHVFTGHYFDNTLYVDTEITSAGNNTIVRIFRQPQLSAMFFRRLRTLTEQFYGAPEANVENSFIYQRLEEQRLLIQDEAVLDLLKWRPPSSFTAYPRNPMDAIDQLQDVFINGRRSFIYNDSRVPNSQTGILEIAFDDINFDSGLEAQQYLRLNNPTDSAVDISGWKLTGSVQHTFRGGTVIPAGGSLYVTKDVQGFQARTTGPRGGLKLFIQGNFAGNLSSGSVNLIAADGTIVDSFASAPPQVASMLRDGGSLTRPDKLISVAVTFTSNVSVPQNSLTLRNDSLGGVVVNISAAGFNYDQNTMTATWRFSSLPTSLEAAFYSFTLDSSLVQSDAGALLDGDGNGTAGGNFTDTLYVAIPGDINLDGDVDLFQVIIVNGQFQNVGDLAVLKSNLGSIANVGWSTGDFNDDGDVDVFDFRLSVGNVGDWGVLIANLGRNVRPPASTPANRSVVLSQPAVVFEPIKIPPAADNAQAMIAPNSVVVTADRQVPQSIATLPNLLQEREQKIQLGSLNRTPRRSADSVNENASLVLAGSLNQNMISIVEGRFRILDQVFEKEIKKDNVFNFHDEFLLNLTENENDGWS